jgi:tripartite ATP-independent transporter DctM subunit
MLTGMPIAAAFLLTCIPGALLFWQGIAGLKQLIMSVANSVNMFGFLPIPLFLLMGNVVFRTGLGAVLIGALDKLLGRLPARLSLLTIAVGTVFGTMIGISGGSIAIATTALLPEMKRRGYHRAMTIGPLVITGTLATLIPPSGFAVFAAAMAGVSAAKVLMGALLPGLLLALLCVAYLLVRVALRPELAPAYGVGEVPGGEKVRVLVRDLLPFLLIIFAVLGVIFLGVCTPSEAAAFGVLACYALAAARRKLTWQIVKESAVDTVQVTAMIFAIVLGAMTFSRILASSGAVAGFMDWVTSVNPSRWGILIATQVVILVLGCFMDPASIVMLTVPVFIPLMTKLGFDPIWYTVLLVVGIQLGMITPPLGLDVYNIRGMASPIDPGLTVEEAFRSSTPFFLLGLAVMVAIIVWPQLVLWLPNMMR